MSANNFVFINQVDTHTYNIYDLDAETFWEEQIKYRKPFAIEEDLTSAIQRANRYMREDIVEYGLQIDLLEDKQKRKRKEE